MNVHTTTISQVIHNTSTFFNDEDMFFVLQDTVTLKPHLNQSVSYVVSWLALPDPGHGLLMAVNLTLIL